MLYKKVLSQHCSSEKHLKSLIRLGFAIGLNQRPKKYQSVMGWHPKTAKKQQLLKDQQVNISTTHFVYFLRFQ